MSIWTNNPFRADVDAADSLAHDPSGGPLKMWLAGVGVAMIPTVYGIHCLLAGRAVLPGQNGDSMETSGPELVSRIQSGSVTADTISSIEVVEPEIGYTASSPKELARLSRRAVINSGAAILRLVTLLRDARPGWTPRNANHPGASHRT